MDSDLTFLDRVNNILTHPVIANLSFGNILFIVIAIALTFMFARLFHRFIIFRLLKHYSVDKGISHSIGTLFRYLFIIICLVIIFQSSGIDLSALALVAGALGVGIGFGLQNITNNLISGIIILFERPIKLGDRVELPELENLTGNVVSISSRSTTIITNDNIAIIVPNSKFISDTVINWSYNDSNVRFNIPVGVSYKEDPEHIRRILVDVAKQHPSVLNSPVPDVLFDEYGDSSLNFVLRVWTQTHSNLPMILRSELYYEIFKSFKREGVEIPYPQRDVYVKSIARTTNDLP